MAADPLIALLIAGLALLVAGAPLGVALTRSPAMGILLAPVLAGLVATSAVIASIVTRLPLPPLLLLVVLASAGLAWWLWGRGEALIELAVSPLTLLIIVAFTLPSLLAVFRAPVGWDARTIWWFHAEWMEEGGDAFVDAMGNDAVSWSHADYPPYSSAAVAGVRSVAPDHDTSRVAQATSTWLSWSALVLVGVALASTFGRRRPLLDGALAGAVVLAFAGLIVDDRGYASGYVDHLWACLLTTAAILVLMQRPGRTSVVLGTVCLAAVALTKNEGMVCAAILVALALVRHRHDLRRHWILGLTLVPAVVWAGLVRGLGVQSDLAEEGNSRGLLTGDREVWSRLDPTVDAIVGLDYSIPFAWILAGAVTTAVLASFAVTTTRRSAGTGSDLWLWALIIAVLGTIVAAFLVSPADIDWHLSTALNRTMLAPTLLLLVSMAIWLRLAVSSLVARQQTPVGTGEPTSTTGPL